MNPQGENDQNQITVNDENGIFSQTQLKEKDYPIQSKAGASKSISTQVDDFPKLIEQMSQKGIAKNILDNVVDFSSFIKKLLQIVQTSTCVFKDLDQKHKSQNEQSHSTKAQESSNEDPVPQLVQNCLDLLLPCILWDPKSLLTQVYNFEQFESLLISGIIKSKSEKIRKSLEQNFKILCYQIEEKRTKEIQQLKPRSDHEKEKDDTSEMKSSLIDEPKTENKDSDQMSKELFYSNPKLFILKILIKNMPLSVIKGKFRNMEYEFFDEYFSLISALIRICKESFSLSTIENSNSMNGEKQFFNQGSQKFDTVTILTFCIDIIKTNYYILSGVIRTTANGKKLSESKQSSAERLLCGYMQLCQSILEIIPQVKAQITQECNLIFTITDFILNTDSSALQGKVTKNQVDIKPQKNSILKKQLSRPTRKRAFSLLLTLCEQNEENFQGTLKVLYNFHGQIEKSWRYIDMNEFDADVGIKQASGYVGLKNFGCTCYMNSLLQQLHMIPIIRKQVLSIQFESDDQQKQELLEDNVLFQLQGMFANLQESEKSYFIPRGFVNAFKFYGEPVNVRIQQDTHEFYNALCDQIEQLIPKPKKAKENGAVEDQSHNFLKNTIGGTLCNETRSLEAEYPYVGERDEDFYAIGLDIKNKKTLHEALDLYIKPDVLEGDNKYQCEQYDRKVSAQRRTYIKDISDTVVIHLKRFEFDYSTMQRYKVNDYCEFPERINFKKWTKEGIEEQVKREQEASERKNDDGDEQVEVDAVDDANEDIDEKFSDGPSASLATDNLIDSDLNTTEMDKKDTQKDKMIKLTNQNTSGGSRNSKQRRIRSSTQRNKGQSKTYSKTNNVDNEPLNLSAEFSDIDEIEEDSGRKGDDLRVQRTTSAEPMQIDSSNPNKEAAIIDEDVNSEDARSVGNTKNTMISSQHDQELQSKRLKKERRGTTTKALISRENTNRGQIPQEQKQKKKKQDKYEYQLVGVLIHSGGADAGHYYSFIKERNIESPNYGKWYEFNDTQVKETSFDQIKKECFGGQQQKNQDNEFENEGQNQQNRMFERCCSAYLVLYERVDKSEEKPSDTLIAKSEVQRQEEHRQQLFNKIHEQNQAFKHLKVFSDSDFIKFMLDFVNLCLFQDVLYFQRHFSDTFKNQMLRKLSQIYIDDHRTQRAKADRQAATQALRGLTPSPAVIQLSRDYYQEQLNIRLNRSDIDIFDPTIEGNNLNLHSNSSDIDTGLKTIQLATILAQDIILKLKDMESFVQLLQKLNTMYQSHALACVWFIKWISEQQHVLQEVLLCSPHPEVREVFATLLSTTFGITVKNEEAYLGEVEQVYDFDCEQAYIDSGEMRQLRIHSSAALRLVKLIIQGMMNCARVNWRNFDEFFILLRDFARCHFQVASYLIQRNMISILLEFVMNNKPPFYNSQGGSSYRMGDSVQQPNFQHAYQLLAYLIKCCLTKGITQVSHYSPFSVFQEENKSIPIPEDHIMGFLTPECQQEILQNAHQSSDCQNQAISEIIIHLSWGDIKVSQFFISELISHIQHRKSSNNTLNFHFQLIQELLSLEDYQQYKQRRIEYFFNFGQDAYGGQGGPSSGQGRNQGFYQTKSIFNFLNWAKQSHPIYTIKLLNFIAMLALREQMVLELVSSMTAHRDWIWVFIHKIGDDSAQIHRAQQRFNINLQHLQQTTIQIYQRIFQISDEFRNQEAKPMSQGSQRQPSQIQGQSRSRQPTQGQIHDSDEQNVVKKIATERAAKLLADAGTVEHDTPRNNQGSNTRDNGTEIALNIGESVTDIITPGPGAVDLEAFQEGLNTSFTSKESETEENILNLINQSSGSKAKNDQMKNASQDRQNDSFSGIPELAVKREKNSSPIAIPSEKKVLDFYPELKVDKVQENDDSPQDQGNHSFMKQEYGEEIPAIKDAGVAVAQQNNFVEDDDDLNIIQKTLNHLEPPPTGQQSDAFNPFKNKGETQINSSSNQADVNNLLGKAEDQLFEQVEFDTNFLQEDQVDDAMMAGLYEEYKDSNNKNKFGGAALSVRTDMGKDLNLQNYDEDDQKGIADDINQDQIVADSGNDVFYDYGREAEDMNDPEFMKRQQEEYEKYQRMFQKKPEM